MATVSTKLLRLETSAPIFTRATLLRVLHVTSANPSTLLHITSHFISAIVPVKGSVLVVYTKKNKDFCMLMENYGSYSFNENNGRPGSYPSPYPLPPNMYNPAPPPHIYPQFPYGSGNNYPYHSLPYHPPYPHSAPLEPPSSHSGPLPHYDYPHSQPEYPYPSPNSQPPPHLSHDPLSPSSFHASPHPQFQHQGSFQYSSSYYHHYQSFQEGFPVPQPATDTHYYHHQESSSSVGISPSNQDTDVSASPSPSSSSLYPMDDLLAGIHLLNLPNTSGSFSGSNSFNCLQRPNSNLNKPAAMYSYPNNSFPIRSEPTPLGALPQKGDSSSHRPSASSSFNSSQHDQNLQIVQYQPSKASLKVLLLHGILDIWVIEARNLPNMDMFHRTLSDMFGGRVSSSVTNMGNKIENHMPRPHAITSDPYVSVLVSNAVVARTYVISNNENPVWMQHSCVPVAHYAAEVRFIVKDSDMVGSQLIGVVAIPVEQIYSGVKVEGSYPILGSNGKPCKQGAILILSIQYTPIEKLTVYHHGVGCGPDYYGVPGTYFPLRKGGKVTLYQDAHSPEGCLPDLKLDRNMHYEHGKCWWDICEAIKQASRLIYITGWSVYHNVRLVRDETYSSCITLGDLLKTKSQEGVRVLLLVWDDPTSRSILGFQMDGLMQTHDEETRRFFKHSSVQVLLCPRSAGKRLSWVKKQEVGTIYTHHQKTVVVDSDAGNHKRKIIAFVGGLDLCDGRYDTPEHPLFRTLQTVHKDDCHNPTFPDPDVSGPREPWHDLHCKIDGPAAYDVLTNFEERWKRSSKPRGIKKLKRSFDDALLRIDRIPDIIAMPEALSLNENDPETWHVQVFRSIDSNSVKGFPKDPRDATSKNLVCGKNVLIDMSIHAAYVKAIRAAEHFIYIENQYFLGSSYNWSSHNDLGADNLIPMEIALKIANKIKAKERFSAYIVIPMWPEGVPTGVATQRILFWQHKTMQMMYETIYKSLEEVGLENTYEPQDYLNFFCLGNREAPDGNNAPYGNSAAENTPRAQAQRSRRFMIYVHSKGMIVDDEYVILGSANINQRSMEGTRDTEIAMGAYQPEHTWEKKLSNPQGQIYGYRMSLWAEHIGAVEECFTHPESLECVRRVKQLGELNWKQFAANDISEMRGHLLKYPVEVDAKGKVKALLGCETFPDVGGNILGSFLLGQENLTI